MPNYTWNTIEADKKVIRALLDENGNFSFQNIIPSPEEIELTTHGFTTKALIGDYLISNFTLKEFERLAKETGIHYQGNRKKLRTKKEIKEYFSVILRGKTVDTITNGTEPDVEVVATVTGKQYFEMHQKYGCHDWYDWHCRYWGTKWDAFDVSVEDDRLCFTTAWSMPEPVFDRICEMFPDEEIKFVSEYEDNALVTGINDEGGYLITGEYERDYPDDYDWDNDENECPWKNIWTGEELHM